MLLIYRDRGAEVPEGTQVTGARIGTAEDRKKCTIMIIGHTKHNVPVGKLAYDWLIKGRGYKSLTLLSSPERQATNFCTAEIRRAFEQSQHKSKKAKVKMVGGLFDSLAPYKWAAKH